MGVVQDVVRVAAPDDGVWPPFALIEVGLDPPRHRRTVAAETSSSVLVGQALKQYPGDRQAAGSVVKHREAPVAGVASTSTVSASPTRCQGYLLGTKNSALWPPSVLT